MWVGTKATSGELGNHATSHHISSFLPLLACQHCEPKRTGRKYRLLRTPPWIGRQKLSPETCVWPVWPLVLFLREHRVHLATSTQALSEIQVLKQLWCSPPQEEMPFVAKEKLLVAIPCISYSLFWYVVFFDIFLGIWFTSHHIKMINTTGPGDPVHRRLEGSSLTLPIKGRSVSEIVSETTGTFCMSGKG